METSKASRSRKRKSTSSAPHVTKKSKTEKTTKTTKTTKTVKVQKGKLKKLQIQKEPETLKEGHKYKKSDEEYLAVTEGLSKTVAANVTELFDQGHTIPFISRYRNHLTNGLKPEKLRKIKATYEYIQQVHKKADQLIQQIKTEGKATQELIFCIESVHTLEELEFLAAPYKKGGKKTLAEQARQLGLDKPAQLFLEEDNLNLNQFVKPENPDLNTVEKVKQGIQHIVAEKISKDTEALQYIEKISSSPQIVVTSKFKTPLNENAANSSKYHIYGNFSQPVTMIRPHQTLAINRGESEKQLTVKIVVPDFLWQPLKHRCMNKLLKSCSGPFKKKLIDDAINDAIKRLLNPLLIRRVRGKLNESAEDEAINIFGSNLKQLLMTTPCLGCVIMGIDPGFKHGCKLAIISPTGSPLACDKFYLDRQTEAMKKLKILVLKYEVRLIALGNGTACRETETLLSSLLEKTVAFHIYNIQYTIISEQAVSIYSCSPAASEEFPALEPLVVGAISIARRLQNPLSELVKVEPKHLGVGMYQHDVKGKKLVSVLDEIVSECVSFVGVDINSASLYLLKRVAGLSTSKAMEIIKYRTEVCTFKRREDVMKVNGISTKTFQQCAGFIRVIPSTARCCRHKNCDVEFNPLDETSIHPESYDIALKIMKWAGVKLSELGTNGFVDTLKRKMNELVITHLAFESKCSELIVKSITDILKEPKNFDLRTLSTGPIFRSKVKTMKEISKGQVLEGVVRNVVSFGAFIDIGVGRHGLLHKSEMKNLTLQLNDRVRVQVLAVDLTTERITLSLVDQIT